MFKDVKLVRQNSGKNQNLDEIENLPTSPNSRPPNQPSSGISRDPLLSIPEPTQTSKAGADKEVGFKSSAETTPTKPKGRGPDLPPFRTPEKQGNLTFGKNKFGWSAYESRNEIKTNSFQTTPTKSVCKPPNAGFAPMSLPRCPGTASYSRRGSSAALSRGVPVFNGLPVLVNTVEVSHYDLKEDPSFWIHHNVQVIIRVRPLNSAERGAQGYNRCVKQESSHSITCVGATGQPEARFTFDHVACETVDQEMLFRKAGLPMVENCLSGYNSCMFAYGQTGSGKTYTMLGDIDDLEFKPSPNRGMTPRIFEYLFARIRAEEESRRDDQLKYSCKCSFLEIYNEQITDLLNPSSANLLLREDVRKGIYVENLSEFEVCSVCDILNLLAQGSLNRKVAATNMNKESSRSHCVFTCVIESKWERDSTTNVRFARLNLVDLAGSERQKTSGAEGERLKEAANINKSLSTLGHVIMVLVDVATGKMKHVPYRDSKLTFLLQESLGGNSKTIIIANISPSSGCAAETLNTLKFAQRAKLIQNNAIVNEDSSGDVSVLQHRIRILEEELSAVKRQQSQHVSRSLSFGPPSIQHDIEDQEGVDMEIDQPVLEDSVQFEAEMIDLTSQQLKSLESIAAGALRREQITETSIKKLEAEIECLNRLVHQREEDTRCSKMKLKFREDKIQRMESLLKGVQPVDSFLLEENAALLEEIRMLQEKVDRNPEVTRFALENIRLLEQVKRYQGFYEEGEREILLSEVSELRDKLIQLLDENSKQHLYSNIPMAPKESAKSSKENDSFHPEQPTVRGRKGNCDDLLSPAEELLNLELELDILKIILKEERSSCVKADELAACLSRELKLAEECILSNRKQYENVNEQLKEAKSITQELESSQLLSINQLEGLKNKNAQYVELLRKQEIELVALKQKTHHQVSNDCSVFRGGKLDDTLFQLKLDKMHTSLEKAKMLNVSYQRDHACQKASEEERDEVRQQAEEETAQVILCLQEELSALQQQVHDGSWKEKEVESRLTILQTTLSEQQEACDALICENEALREQIKDKEEDVKSILKEWELLEGALTDGHDALVDASEQFDSICGYVPKKGRWIIEQVHKLTKKASEKDLVIEELNVCLENENARLNDMDSMLRSLKGAALVITESHQKECSEKEKEIYRLKSELSAKSTANMEIESKISLACDEMKKASKCATVAFVIVNRLSEINSGLLDALKSNEFQLKESIESNQIKDGLLDKCAVASEEAETQIEALRKELELTEERCNKLEDEHAKKQFVITEFHQKECNEREKEIHRLKSELSEKSTANMEIESKISLTCDEMKKASKCATVAFVIVNRLSEINSCHLDSLKHIVFQLNESVESNQMKDGLLEKCAVESEEAERQIETLKKELELAKESCNRLGDEIAKQQVYISVTERQLEEYHELDILKTKERLSVLQEGVSTVKSCMNKYAKQSKQSTKISVVVDGSKDTRLDERGHTFEVCSNTSIHEDSKENVKSAKTLKGETSNDTTIILLRNEIELALESLKEVQAVVDHLHAEKQELLISERQNCEGMEVVKAQLCHIQAAFGDFEDQCLHKVKALNQKLEKAEQHVEEASRCWCQAKEIFEGELSNATIDIAKRTAEASCLFSKFEEAQDIMKEADVMIKGLMILNETLKLQIEDLKRENLNLSCERDVLVQDIESLQSLTALDIRKCHELIEQLEITLAQAQGSSEEAFFSLSSDISFFKNQFLDSKMLIQSWLEDTCSEIIVKGSAISVLHFCHMGILLEAVTRLNAENCLLQNGLCESNVTISHLREQNMKSVQELESFHILKAKFLAAIERSSDRITTTEAETEELGAKLRAFESKITDLQLQEEQMLERSNYLEFELANLVKDLNQSNSDGLTSLLEQETLLNDNKEANASEAENLYTELSAKDLELLIMTSELQELADEKAKMGTEHISFCKVLEHLRKEVITVSFSSSFTEQLLFEADAEVNHLQKEIGEVNLLWTRSCGDVISLDVINIVLKEELILQKEITFLNEKQNCELHEALQEKDSELMSCQVQIQNLSLENCRLQESIHAVESNITFLQGDLYLRKADLEKLQYSHSSTNEKLRQKSLELQNHLTKMNALEEENMSLKEELRCLQLSQYETLRLSSCSAAKCLNLTESTRMESHRICSVLNEKIEILSERLSQDNSENIEVLMKIQEALEPLDTNVEDIISENFTLKDELIRKDVVLNGLLFDMRLLQESASSTKDQKDEIEELTDSLKLKEEALEARSRELDDAVAGVVELEAQIEEKIVKISLLEGGLSTATNAVELLSKEKADLTSHVKEISIGKAILERELVEKQKLVESFQTEVIDMENSISQLNASIESLKDELEEVSSDRDNLQKELLDLEEKIDTAQALAEEYEEIAMEAKQIAESRRIYGEEKEEEVRLLEKSVQELDRIVDVMENKVDILKEEAERQRLQREELEMELDSLKHQVHNLKSADSDIKRELDEKERILQNALNHVRKLEKDLVNKDTEISRCNAHITELNLHAEAQASEYKKQFKTLEAMAGQVKSEGHSSHGKNSSSSKLEKNATKPRGTGSPFKCIGLGLSQQLKLEKDEELTAERLRIQELEALAANRQKEIFVLHNRLAAAESMTHDVNRDLLGLKLDMTNYVSILDKQQGQKIAENGELDNVDSGVKVEEIRKLKKLLSGFIEERKGWLEEIDRTQLALEKLHQRDKSLTAENEVLKADVAKYKKKIMELGGEVNKLSGQQNIHQQINHHAKIKEENKILKRQNEELSIRLQKAQTFLLRLRGKLARFPACDDGVNMYTDLDEEIHLRNKLKETEEERVQLAQVVLGLCSSILKAAGMKKQVSGINVALAEEALEQLRLRNTSLERELENLRVKSRIEKERIRLSTIVLQSPPLRQGAEDNNCITPTRNSQSPFFTALDR